MNDATDLADWTATGSKFQSLRPATKESENFVTLHVQDSPVSNDCLDYLSPMVCKARLAEQHTVVCGMCKTYLLLVAMYPWLANVYYNVVH